MERKQWRVTFTSGTSGGVAFIDESTEEIARAKFAVMFPRAAIASCTLEPVDPCAQYERRPA